MGFMIAEEITVFIGTPVGTPISLMQAMLKKHSMAGKGKADGCCKERKETKRKGGKDCSNRSRRQFNSLNPLKSKSRGF